jgi:hypothetical protein
MKQFFFTLAFCLLTVLPSFAQNTPQGLLVRNNDFLSAPTSLTLQEDGSCIFSSGGWSIKGTYKIDASTISFTDTEGNFADTMAGKGTYKFKIEGNNITFTLVKDRAVQRKHLLVDSGWKQQ